MREEQSGPHETHERWSPIVAIGGGLRMLDDRTRTLRHLPVAGLHLTTGLIPGADRLAAPVGLAEAALRRVLRDPIDDTESASPDGDVVGGLYPRPDDETLTAPPDPRTSLRSMVQEMLERSMVQSPRQAKEADFKRLLLQLVPDEVRILAALADGNHHPVISVGFGPPGSVGEVVLRYASTVGRRAGVRRQERVPSYVERLEHLGLVVIGPEEDGLAREYEILEAQRQVRRADDTADSSGSAVDRLSLKSVRHARYAVYLSELGRELWDMAQPDLRDYQVPERSPD